VAAQARRHNLPRPRPAQVQVVAVTFLAGQPGKVTAVAPSSNINIAPPVVVQAVDGISNGGALLVTGTQMAEATQHSMPVVLVEVEIVVPKKLLFERSPDS